METKSTSLHARAPTLVLLPGLDGTGELFAPLCAAAAPTFATHVLRYDHDPDQSYARLAEVLAPQLPQDRPFVLIGESFGGPLALRLALAAPRGLVAIVFVNTYLRSPIGFLAGRALTLMTTLLAHAPDLSFMLGDDASRTLVEQVRGALRSMPASVLRARIVTLRSCDETSSYLHCMAPMFYLHGSEDRLLPKTALELFEYVRPGLVVENLAAPHLLLQRKPAEALACLQRWLLEDKGYA